MFRKQLLWCNHFVHLDTSKSKTLHIIKESFILAMNFAAGTIST